MASVNGMNGPTKEPKTQAELEALPEYSMFHETKEVLENGVIFRRRTAKRGRVAPVSDTSIAVFTEGDRVYSPCLDEDGTWAKQLVG